MSRFTLFLKRLRRSVTVLILFVATTLFARFALLFRPSSTKLPFIYSSAHRLSKRLCRSIGAQLRIHYEGRNEAPMLVVANHFGYLDIVLLCAVLPVGFVAKSELRKRPLLGWISDTYGTVFVSRDRKMKSLSFVEQVRKRLQAGYSIGVFPEGRATPGDTIEPFKTGAFEAVVGTGIPVLPVHLGIESVDGNVPVRAFRDRVAWRDPMPLYRHIWNLLGSDVTFSVTVASPVYPVDQDRKTLATQTQSVLTEIHRTHLKRLGLA